MKGRKYKRSQRFVRSVYGRVFGLRPPFQLILDADFLDVCLAQKLDFKSLLPTVFGGPVKLFTTQCVMNELRRRHSGAIFNAKRLELRRCPHTGQNLCGADCIRDVVGTDNKCHYAVGAQQDDLRSLLRETPGTPLVFINRGILLMEDPSEATLKKAREMQQNRMKPSESELKIIREMTPVPEPLEQNKKRKKREPNPLSRLKKKIKQPSPTLSEEADKRKRTRKHRPRK